ncbi:MAG: hypothetical protein V4585_07560 [Bacteroidota bacterium]|jgi:hypothetical protein
MALNIPNQQSIPNTQESRSSVIEKIKELFASPLTITIVALAFILGYFFEWWTVAIAAFIGGAIFAKSSGEAFAKGTTAISTLWLLAAWYQHFSTAGILSNKIAQILPVGGNVGLLILITIFIGGIVGGFGAMSGFLCRDIIRK